MTGNTRWRNRRDVTAAELSSNFDTMHRSRCRGCRYGYKVVIRLIKPFKIVTKPYNYNDRHCAGNESVEICNVSDSFAVVTSAAPPGVPRHIP